MPLLAPRNVDHHHPHNLNPRAFCQLQHRLPLLDFGLHTSQDIASCNLRARYRRRNPTHTSYLSHQRARNLQRLLGCIRVALHCTFELL
jgi:hypothetical protein